MIIAIDLPSKIRIQEMTDLAELELYLWGAGAKMRELESRMEALEARIKELKGAEHPA